VKLQFGSTQIAPLIAQFKRWLPARAKQLDKLLSDARLGIEIELRVIKPAHSNEQRGLYWSSLHDFGRWLGYSTRETESLLHAAICCEAFGQDGVMEQVICGRTYSWAVPRETSSKTTDGRKRDAETYGELIDTLARVASEHGFVIERSDQCGA
jgi:hypothetical protein